MVNSERSGGTPPDQLPQQRIVRCPVKGWHRKIEVAHRKIDVEVRILDVAHRRTGARLRPVDAQRPSRDVGDRRGEVPLSGTTICSTARVSTNSTPEAGGSPAARRSTSARPAARARHGRRARAGARSARSRGTPGGATWRRGTRRSYEYKRAEDGVRNAGLSVVRSAMNVSGRRGGGNGAQSCGSCRWLTSVISDCRETCKKKCDIIHDRCHESCTKNDPTQRCRKKCNDEYASCLRDCDRNC